MKKKLLGFLIMTITLTSLSLSIAGFYYFFLTAQNEIENVQESVKIQMKKQLKIFDTLLNQNLILANDKIQKELPLIAEIIKKNKTIYPDIIHNIANDYGFESLSIIDKNGGIIVSSLKERYNQPTFINKVIDIYQKDKSKTIFLTNKQSNNKLFILGYYSPTNSNYIIECSLNIKKYISTIYSKEYKNYIFHGLFDIITDANQYVENIEIIGFDNDSHWSLIYDETPINKNIIREVRLHDKVEFMDKNQRLTVFSLLKIKDLKIKTIGKRQNICAKVVYNFIPLYDSLRAVLMKTFLIILLFIGIIFLISARFIHKYIISRIVKINKLLIKIANGNYVDQISITYSDELGEIAKSANDMQSKIMTRESELEEARKTLEVKVVERTRELANTNKQLNLKFSELDNSEKYIHELLQQIIDAQEIEMHKISRELHDNVAQDLSSLNILISHFFDDEQQPSIELLEKHQNLLEVAKKTLRIIRNLSYTLHPSSIEQLGLSVSITELTSEFQEHNSINISLTIIGMTDLNLPFSTQINIYRIIQEALNNIKNHSKSLKANIKIIASYPDIIIRIEDFGIGFDVENRLIDARKNKRMGMRSMQERVLLLKGSLSIKSEIKKGVKLLIRIPIP